MSNKVSDNILTTLEQELVTDFDAERPELRKEVKTHIQQVQQKYKDGYDRKRKGESIYKEGDLVAIKRTQFVTGKK